MAADVAHAKATLQSELDDLLMVLGDTEEKLDRYKTRLSRLGEEVSDGGEEDDSDEDDEDEDAVGSDTHS